MKRLDIALVERGLCDSREKAKRAIMAGQVKVNEQVARKSSDLVGPDDQLVLLAGEKYVSRGGHKLEHALQFFQLDVTGATAVDLGASTGGFTDCLLQHGAAHVTGVDVGHGQLHDRLRGDPRVTCVEKLNARELRADQVGNDFDLVTGDLSFISLALVLPALVPLLRSGGHLLMLAKPQFELQPGQLGKGGIVRDASLFAVVESKLRDACASLGLQVLGWYDSPIAGGDGNREFFIHARRSA